MRWIDGEFVLVAAAGGAPEDHEAERSRLWPELCARNPALSRVARRAQRAIPLVILRADEWAPFGP